MSAVDAHGLIGPPPNPSGYDENGKKFKIFDYTGSLQTWTVPAGVSSVTIECIGARGGGCHRGSDQALWAPGGAGGYAKGDYAVSPSDILNIYVGGHGEDCLSASSAHSGHAGGWNGGGDTLSHDAQRGGSAGGGGTDVRLNGTALGNRIIVAGGGGGSTGKDGATGGHGGGLIGGAASGHQADGGTQSAGGSASPYFDSGDGRGSDGSLATGGSQTTNGAGNYGVGAGGGGYYGGGCGSTYSNFSYGGGGGSSYVGSGTTTTIAGEAGRQISTLGSLGHGRVKITWQP